MIKKCGKCVAFKEIIHFYKDRTTKDGLAWQCINCAKEKQRLFQQTEAGKAKGRKDAQIFRKRHPDRVQKYVRDRKMIDTQFKLANSLRGRLRSALKRKSKKGSAVKDLGCSIIEFEKYIESLFYPNPITGETMTWANWSIPGWHLDHIIPLIHFNLDDPDQFLKAIHYTNFQPLWAIDHYKKSPKERKLLPRT
jgi:hypothetical protein